jgi:adenosyl cobinamide kinase/adenosyl cobinamide phosphate guanylyltransferase
MARIVLILGGARSGRSRFAQQLAERVGGASVLFVATAVAGDREMASRIEAHRNSRPRAWDILEEPIGVASALAAAPDRYQAVVIDCLTLLASNVILSCGDPVEDKLAEQRMRQETDALIAASRRRQGAVIIVSNEVGAGLVPDNSLGRIFRDVLGWTNQTIASEADAVYLMVAGLPVEVKSLAQSLEQAAEAVASGRTEGAFAANERQ